MKNIKTLFLFALGLGIATLVNAQDVKAEVSKPIEPKPTTDNRPSPIILKPEAGAQPAAAVAVTPSPKSRDGEQQRQEQAPKTVVLTIDADLATKNLTPEQIRTSNGKTDKPKAVVITAPAPKEQ